MATHIAPQSQRPESWPDDFPPRSRLFGVAPYGIDGATLENIVSFFRRTSHAQGSLPRSLAYHLIVPSMGIPTRASTTFMATECYRLDLCGTNATAARWVNALNEFTFRFDLQLLTLLSFRSFVSSYQLIQPETRFCPACYVEDEQAGREKYDRLLWAIRCVTACPIHACRLIFEPRTNRQNHRQFTVPGISRFDGRSLAKTTRERASSYDVKISKMVSEMIDELRREENKIPLTSHFFAEVAKKLFNGNSAALARHLGLSKSQVHGWMCDGILPSLSCVARVAYTFECTMSDVIFGNTSSLRLRHGSKLPRGLFGFIRRDGYKTPRRTMLASLTEFMKCNPDSNAKAAAIHLGVSPKFLRNNFPEQNEALVIAGRCHRRRTSQVKLATKDSAYEESHRALKHNGVYPSRRRVVKRLKELGIRLTFADERRAKKKAEATCEHIRPAGRN